LLVDLKMNVRRIAAMVDQNPADAWLVIAGSQELLQWFLTRKIAVMAMFGRRRELPVAGVGPDKVPATASATRELIRLGHKRIVYLTRRLRRLPRPGATEQSFLNEMAAHGVTPSPYNLPDWEESVEGFHARLDALVQITPPTALILDEVPLFLAAQQFLAENGIRVPEDVSLICTDTSQDFAWCRRSVAHIRWDSLAVVRRVVRWAANVSRGKEDLRQTLTAAKFVAGGTIVLREQPVNTIDLCDLVAVDHLSVVVMQAEDMVASLPPEPSAPRLPRLASLVVGSAPVSEALRRALAARITPHVWVTYGSNEFGEATCAAPDIWVRHPGSVGRPAYTHDQPHPHRVETGSPHARWAVVERTAHGWQAQLRSTAYDWHASADRAAALGFADWAHELRSGRAAP
jgi:hypothetical protein